MLDGHGANINGRTEDMASKKQIVANRENSQKAGVRTPEGKAVSRLNARKHGIFASALTAQDEAEMHEVLTEFSDWIRPVGPIEEALVEKLAETYLRLQRCARAAAFYHELTWRPHDYFDYQRKEHVSNFDFDRFEATVRLFGRYDTALTNQLLHLLHEIERLQRMRLGDDVRPPMVCDVTVHEEGADAAEMSNCETNPISPEALPSKELESELGSQTKG